MIKKLLSIITFTLVLSCGNNSGAENSSRQAWGYLPFYAVLNSSEINRALREYRIISASGFFLGRDGSIKIKKETYLDSVAEQCAKSGCGFYPLITFADSSAGIRILSSDALIEKAAGQLKLLVQRKKYTAIHLDLEYISPTYKHRLAALLAAIKKSNGNTKITFALYPQAGYSTRYSGFHDISLIHPYIDEAVVMCYDLHCMETGPGPVTDLEWAERNIQHILRFMKPEKLRLGIPAYGYIWDKNGKAHAVSAKNAVTKTAGKVYERTPSGNLKISYGENTGYVSDRDMRDKMKKLSDKYKLAGWAVWRIGFED